MPGSSAFAEGVASAAPHRWFDRDRFRRMRNIQSSEFYSRLVMRPLTILLLLVVGDWKWLTPNLVTTMANLTKLAGAALLVINHHEYAVTAAIVLQVGVLLDHVDGTLARYRGIGSAFGAFYDKVGDAVTWIAISGALGYAAYRDSGDVWMPIAAVAAAYLLLVMGYMKWLVAAANPKKLQAPVSFDPPSRTRAQWRRWFASSLVRILYFEEIDLFFWIGLGLIIDQLPLTILLLVVSQGAQLVRMCIKRGLEMRALDATRVNVARAA